MKTNQPLRSFNVQHAEERKADEVQGLIEIGGEG